MKVYGQLEKAQLENLSADPAGTAAGMAYYNTTINQIKYYNGTSWIVVTDQSTAQILTNKDHDGGTASNSSRITLPSSTLATLNTLTRKAGTILYATDQGKPYIDTGTALTPIVTGSVPNLSVSTKTAAYTLTSSDDFVIFSGATGAYNITMPSPASNVGKVFRLVRSDNTMANVLSILPSGTETFSGYAALKLHTQWEEYELTTDGTNWFILTHKATTAWTSYTPTFAGIGAPAFTSFFWRRSGDSMFIIGNVVTGTIASSTLFSATLPAGASMNNSIIGVGGKNQILGTITRNTSAGGWNILSITSDATNQPTLLYGATYSAGTSAGVNPFTPENATQMFAAGELEGFVTTAIAISGWIN